MDDIKIRNYVIIDGYKNYFRRPQYPPLMIVDDNTNIRKDMEFTKVRSHRYKTNTHRSSLKKQVNKIGAVIYGRNQMLVDMKTGYVHRWVKTI